MIRSAYIKIGLACGAATLAVPLAATAAVTGTRALLPQAQQIWFDYYWQASGLPALARLCSTPASNDKYPLEPMMPCHMTIGRTSVDEEFEPA